MKKYEVLITDVNGFTTFHQFTSYSSSGALNKALAEYRSLMYETINKHPERADLIEECFEIESINIKRVLL